MQRFLEDPLGAIQASKSPPTRAHNIAAWAISASRASCKADALAKVLEQDGKLERVGTFKTLLVCRKVG